MRALGGVLSLLLVLAALGLVAKTQRKVVGDGTAVPVPLASEGGHVPAAQASDAPSSAASPQQLQERIRSDVSRALDRGAARNDDATQ
jgi:hypothetical protein